MDLREEKNKIPCIVDEGVVVNRRDMVRILRDLGHVRYTDFDGDRVRTVGEGYVTSVFSNGAGSTIFVNKRLYINVNSFDYLKLSKLEDETAAFDLVDEQRTVRLIPLSDALQERQPFVTDHGIVQSPGAIERIFGESMAEVYYDEDFEEQDE